MVVLAGQIETSVIQSTRSEYLIFRRVNSSLSRLRLFELTRGVSSPTILATDRSGVRCWSTANQILLTVLPVFQFV